MISAALVAAAVGSGVYAGVRLLQHRRLVVLSGLHLVLGAASLETVLLLMRGAPDGREQVIGPAAWTALILFTLAMVSGLATPLLTRKFVRSANGLLIVHTVVGLCGFVSFCLWLPSI